MSTASAARPKGPSAGMGWAMKWIRPVHVLLQVRHTVAVGVVVGVIHEGVEAVLRLEVVGMPSPSVSGSSGSPPPSSCSLSGMVSPFVSFLVGLGTKLHLLGVGDTVLGRSPAGRGAGAIEIDLVFVSEDPNALRSSASASPPYIDLVTLSSVYSTHTPIPGFRPASHNLQFVLVYTRWVLCAGPTGCTSCRSRGGPSGTGIPVEIFVHDVGLDSRV